MSHILFSLSGAAWAVLGTGEFGQPLPVMAATALAAFLALYFLTKSQPVTPVGGQRLLPSLAIGLVLVILRHGYFQNYSPLTVFLLILSLYAPTVLASRLLCPGSSEESLPLEKPHWQIPLGLAGLSIAYTFVFSYVGPLHPQIPEVDAAIFSLMGKAWRQGVLPYMDMFDHKGPLIFFLHMLGQWIHEDLGVYLLQILAMFITLWFAYRSAGRGKGWDGWGLCAVMGVLIYLYRYEYGYSLTEEFCLPLLMVSSFYAAKYLLDVPNTIPHPPLWAFLHGLTFAVCLLTRVTNALAICIYVAGIVVILLSHKQWKNLGLNALGFLAGVFCLVLPFTIYFASAGGLYDFIWGMLLYNLSYSQGSIGMSWGVFRVICHVSWPAWSFLILTLVTLKRHRAFSIVSALSILATWYYVCSGNLYAHYFVILAPFIPLSFYMLRELAPGKQRLTAALMAVILAGTWGIKGVQMVRDYDYISQPPGLEIASQTIADLIPEEDHDRVIGYNVTARFYLFSDLMPCFKYCMLQDWQTQNSLQMEQENEAFFRSGTAKWLVIGTEVKTPSIKKAMEENYTFYEAVYFEGGESEALTLYKLNE